MNKPQLVEELKKLGVELTGTETKPELEALLASRLPQPVTEKSGAEGAPVEPEKVELPKVEDRPVLEVVKEGRNLGKNPELNRVVKTHIKGKEVAPGSIGVWLKGNFVRTYSEKEHGEGFMDLAREFAKKTGAELKELTQGATVNDVGWRKGKKGPVPGYNE